MSKGLSRGGTIFKIKSPPRSPDYIAQLFAIEPRLTASGRLSDGSPGDGVFAKPTTRTGPRAATARFDRQIRRAFIVRPVSRNRRCDPSAVEGSRTTLRGGALHHGTLLGYALLVLPNSASRGTIPGEQFRSASPTWPWAEASDSPVA